MAIAQLFFKKGNFIGTIELDVILSEGASAAVRVTKNPVENGADINDHIIVDPMTFTMQGVVSDIKTNAVASALTLAKSNIPSKEAWEQLLELQASRIPFELVTNLKTYPNVIIQSITEVQDKDTSNALFFSATLTEIILVGEPVPTVEQFNDQDTADKAIAPVVGGQKTLKEL
ncbi:hypothetical protein KAR91_14825 [Candidatus Pacearchaeota archaeon]|nr:hypothetical protein [Candidatus Pacearchaeota archaeon]